MSTGESIVVIDDHDLVAASLTYAFAAQGFDAHRIPVSDLDTVRDAALAYSPGVALLDLNLGVDDEGRSLDGVELVPSLCAQGWSVLVVTGTDELDRVDAAIAAGAANWVVKGADFAELRASVAELAEGRGRLGERERRAMIERHREFVRTRGKDAARLEKLSETEHSVLNQLAEGSSPAEIAEHTYTSIHTVRAHIRSILAKLDVNSQRAAAAIAHHQPVRRDSISVGSWRKMRGGVRR